MEQYIDRTISAIDSGDADRLFAMACERDRRAEGLTVARLREVLAIFRRETRGATHGPPIVTGDLSMTSAEITYSKRGVPVAVLSLEADAGLGGQPCVPQLTYALVVAASVAATHPGPNVMLNRLDYQRALLAGFVGLKPQLQAAGIQRLVVGGSGNSLQSLDEVIAAMKTRISRTAAQAVHPGS